MPVRPSTRDLLRRITACVVVALYAFLATVGTSLVICQEADGRVAIEWRGSDCCDGERPATSSAQAGASVSATGADGGGECAECVDETASSLLTSRSAASMRSQDLPSPHDIAAPAPVAASRPVWTICAEPVALRPRAAPNPPPQLAALRTVVFRC